MLKQELMTRAQFERFAAGHDEQHGGQGPLRILVAPPFELQPCACGDLNCHGWRYVEVRGAVHDVIGDQELADAGV